MTVPFISILNDVLGPVMRGPSSSHTAGSHRIGKMVYSLLGEKPQTAQFTFDPSGSYSQVYKQQGVDLGLAAGLMDWSLTHSNYLNALESAKNQGIEINFRISSLKNADHPNSVDIHLSGKKGHLLTASAKSIGGGLILITEINNITLPVPLDGKDYVELFCAQKYSRDIFQKIQKILPSAKITNIPVSNKQETWLMICSSKKISQDDLSKIKQLIIVSKVISCPPVFFPQKGTPLFSNAVEMVDLALKRKVSLGSLMLEYESILLGMTKKQILNEMIHRFEIMKKSVVSGLDKNQANMRFLESSASSVFEANQQNKLPIGGIHSLASSRALAAMHTAASMGIVCAAPTGGSAGVIPGVVVTLAEKYKLNSKQVAYLLLAAGGIGLIIAHRATFAAEIAGCQVEIGAAGAMACASVIEAFGGSADMASDGAAICLQNSMGSVCDLVQGTCEIPCHTRNAAAASTAFTCADLIAGGYKNPIPLDETIDAVFQVGKFMPPELRVTSLGGLAVTPSAQALKPKK